MDMKPMGILLFCIDESMKIISEKSKIGLMAPTTR